VKSLEQARLKAFGDGHGEGTGEMSGLKRAFVAFLFGSGTKA
jgi:hypothetical protein